MANDWALFNRIVRKAQRFTEAPSQPAGGLHPFETRNVHGAVDRIVRKMFDDGYFAQATFEAYKFLDKEVQRHSGSTKAGRNLMMEAFKESSPLVQLTPLSNTSEVDEQEGYKYLFAGSVIAIRNPRGHEVALPDTPDQCLDHLSLASLLLRRLEQSGFK